MKKILCFGDSNTWGYSASDGRRYSKNERWPGILAQLMSSDCQILEDGQPGRTTFFEDASTGFVNGADALLPSLKNHQPDIVILMLGTNDLNSRFNQSAEDISKNAAKMTETILANSYQQQGGKTEVILVTPPRIKEIGYFGQLFTGGAEKSAQFPHFYKMRASELQCHHVNADEIVCSGDTDGVHWDLEQHSKMATAIAEQLRKLL